MSGESHLNTRIENLKNQERLKMTADTKLARIESFFDQNPRLSEFTSYGQIVGYMLAFIRGMPNPVYINKLNEIQNASPEIYTDFKTILDEALKAWIEWSNATKENT